MTLGRKVGNKALLWGAVSGLIPDLDMIAGPFLDSVSRMTFHRSFSHSILFALLLAPLLGYLIFRLYKGKEANWWDWTLLAFWSLITHPLLDNFTSYGTQLFWPFSGFRVAYHSISVIDPLYTLPMLAALVALIFLHRTSRKRRVLNYLGIGLSTSYLLFTAVNELYVNSVFARQLDAQDIKYQRILAAPTPLNNILWRGVAESDSGFYEGYYSLFDKSGIIRFEYTPKNHRLIKPYRRDPDIEKLARLTKGFFVISEVGQDLYFNDMRYGRMPGWGKEEGEYIFSFRITVMEPVSGKTLEIRRVRPQIPRDFSMFKTLARRALGYRVKNIQ